MALLTSRPHLPRAAIRHLFHVNDSGLSLSTLAQSAGVPLPQQFFESLLLLFLNHLFLVENGADGVDQHLVDADCEVVMDDRMDELTQIGLVQSPATTATTLHQQQMPSYEQQQGIAALYALNDAEIFGHLTALRSLKASLTDKQLKALESLSSAPNDHIKTWLDFGRHISGMAIWKSIERGRLKSPRR